MDYHGIYESNAEQYQALVAAEDTDGNLLPAIEAVLSPEGATIVEVGAGTGRVTRLLGSAGATVLATEPAAAMIGVARGLDGRALLARAEAGSLPFRSESGDAAIAGWVLAHQREWAPDHWRSVVAGFIAEMGRVTRPGGPIILIETLGTGFEEPSPPPELAEYYEWLESSMGFSRTWFRTDYEFGSVAEAAEITGSFFGPDFAAQVVTNDWSRVPECTGIWVRRVSATGAGHAVCH